VRVWSGFMWPLQDHWQALANSTVRLQIPRTPAVSSRTVWNLPNGSLFRGIYWLNSRLTHHCFLVYPSLQIVWKNLIASLKYHFCVTLYDHYSWHNMCMFTAMRAACRPAVKSDTYITMLAENLALTFGLLPVTIMTRNWCSGLVVDASFAWKEIK